MEYERLYNDERQQKVIKWYHLCMLVIAIVSGIFLWSTLFWLPRYATTNSIMARGCTFKLHIADKYLCEIPSPKSCCIEFRQIYVRCEYSKCVLTDYCENKCTLLATRLNITNLCLLCI